MILEHRYSHGFGWMDGPNKGWCLYIQFIAAKHWWQYILFSPSLQEMHPIHWSLILLKLSFVIVLLRLGSVDVDGGWRVIDKYIDFERTDFSCTLHQHHIIRDRNSDSPWMIAFVGLFSPRPVGTFMNLLWTLDQIIHWKKRIVKFKCYLRAYKSNSSPKTLKNR